MSRELLLSTDMDRTVIPNGSEPESPAARPLLRRLAARPEVTLAYASGRDLELIRNAIVHYRLPAPDFAVADVGTTVYAVTDDVWTPLTEWRSRIAEDWRGRTTDDVEAVIGTVPDLALQEPERQKEFKLSYYTPATFGRSSGLARIRKRLQQAGVRAAVVWSVDAAANRGLLDVVPERATKLEATRFLMESVAATPDRTVFAGDSGNDLPALTGGLQAVLVGNAADDVRREAIAGAARNGTSDRLYLAAGGFLGMNGHYAAGVLEGVVHFVPEARDWLDDTHARGGRT